jgi:hypothetical protein
MLLRVELLNASSATTMEQGRLMADSRSKDGFGPRKSSERLDTLLQALDRYRSRRSMDPRDKVYAILRLDQDF